MSPLLDPRLADPAFLRLAGLAAQRRKQAAQSGQGRVLPQTDDALWQYVWETWGAAIPRQHVCPHHTAPFTAFADAYFVRDSMHVWEGSRGFSGKSYLLALLGLAIAATRGGSVNILGGSGEQSRRVHEYMDRAWQAPAAPRQLLTGEPLAMRTRLVDGSIIQCLLASSTSIRGGHPVSLLLDECFAGDTPIATPLGDRVIASLSVGENVLSVDEYGAIIPSVVLAMRCTGAKQTIRLHFEGDIVLGVTKNHPFLTPEGWQNAGSLTPGRDTCLSVHSMCSIDCLSETEQDWPLSILPYPETRCRSAQMRRLRQEALWEKPCSVSDMPDSISCWQETLLPRLWEPYFCLQWGSTMSSLPLQVASGSCLALPGLWNSTESAWDITMQALSSQTYVCNAHGRTAEQCTCDSSAQRTTVKKRNSVSGTSRSVGIGLRSPGVFWSMDYRLFSDFAQSGHRSPRRILASASGEHCARFAQAESARSQRVYRTFSGDREASSVVERPLRYLRVLAVHEGPVVPVYNLTVAGTHTFIANSMVVHNCDEFTLPLFDAAMGQTLGQPGRPAVTVAASTHQYPDGTMSTIKQRAAEHGWRRASWCFRETLQPNGWLSPAEVDRKRREVPASMWNVEFELQEPSPESRAIDPAAVETCFQAPLGHFAGRQREYVEVEAPVAGAIYAHGADWARAQDFTEIVTLRMDCAPLRLVAYERMHRLPWPQMVSRFDARLARYKQPGQRREQALHDKTGIGDVVDGFLTEDAMGFVFAGRARADLFSEAVGAIERGDIVSPLIESLKSQLQYCTVNDLYGAGHPPDGFVALALAYRAATAKPSSGQRAGVWGS